MKILLLVFLFFTSLYYSFADQFSTPFQIIDTQFKPQIIIRDSDTNIYKTEECNEVIRILRQGQGFKITDFHLQDINTVVPCLLENNVNGFIKYFEERQKGNLEKTYICLSDVPYSIVKNGKKSGALPKNTILISKYKKYSNNLSNIIFLKDGIEENIIPLICIYDKQKLDSLCASSDLSKLLKYIDTNDKRKQYGIASLSPDKKKLFLSVASSDYYGMSYMIPNMIIYVEANKGLLYKLKLSDTTHSWDKNIWSGDSRFFATAELDSLGSAFIFDTLTFKTFEIIAKKSVIKKYHYIVVWKNKLNFRINPDNTSKRVAGHKFLEPFSILYMIKRKGDWFNVLYLDWTKHTIFQGWVRYKYYDTEKKIEYIYVKPYRLN